MLPPGGNRVAKPWHILKNDDHILPQTKYKLKPFRGCKPVSGSEWDCTVTPTVPCNSAQERKLRFPMFKDVVVNVLQFCALQFTFASLDRKSNLKSP